MRLPDQVSVASRQTAPARLGLRLGSHLARQEALCVALEQLADSLPHRFDTYLGLSLARRVWPTLRRAHIFEERVIFPVLIAARGDLADTLDRLHGEHLEDEDQAADLHDAIIALVADRSRRDAERIGYMLRGLFIGLGRHLAFEREHLLPLLASDSAR